MPQIAMPVPMPARAPGDMPTSAAAGTPGAARPADLHRAATATAAAATAGSLAPLAATGLAARRGRQAPPALLRVRGCDAADALAAADPGEDLRPDEPTDEDCDRLFASGRRALLSGASAAAASAAAATSLHEPLLPPLQEPRKRPPGTLLADAGAVDPTPPASAWLLQELHALAAEQALTGPR
jgi:hypothetical protein